jgi:hypothetical protein
MMVLVLMAQVFNKKMLKQSIVLVNRPVHISTNRTISREAASEGSLCT